MPLAGFKVEHSADYPGWKPEPDSEIVRKSRAVFEELFGTAPSMIAMHAGLETGVLGVNYPDMQMISFGPQIEHPHSPAERVQISSVAEFWKYLTAVLEELTGSLSPNQDACASSCRRPGLPRIPAR